MSTQASNPLVALIERLNDASIKAESDLNDETTDRRYIAERLLNVVTSAADDLQFIADRLAEHRERLTKDAKTLTDLQGQHSPRFDEHAHIGGKVEGVKLSLGKFDEIFR